VSTGKLRRGAALETITITAHPTAATFKFRGTGTAYYSQGTAKSTFNGTGTLHRGGHFTLSGRGHYIGGTLYRHTSQAFTFTATAPRPPSSAPAPPCSVPAGWHAVAGDADLIVILENQTDPTQEYRYCRYAEPSRGFRLLVKSDSCDLAGTDTCSKIDGVALSYVLYDTSTAVDSPACGGPNPVKDGSSTIYAFNAASRTTVMLAQGQGGITSAGLTPPGVAVWILTDDPCFHPPLQRSETLQTYSINTGAVTTLDTGDPGESDIGPPALANLRLYPCAAGCAANNTVVAWTHDGTWRYQQLS
jgi:hypothetical protein